MGQHIVFCPLFFNMCPIMDFLIFLQMLSFFPSKIELKF